MPHRAALVVGICGALALLPSAAAAAPGAEGSASVSTSGGVKASGGARGPTSATNPTLADKKVRIHAGTDFFSFSHFNPDGPGDGINTLGFGIGRSTGLDRAGLFYLNPAGLVSLGAGGVILGGRAVVGGELAFTVDGVDVGNDGGALVMGRFTPYFNWMFGPFGRVRPWIGLRFGLGGAASHYETIDVVTGDTVDAVDRSIFPIVGLNGGAHVFVASSVSVDLGVTFEYAAPHYQTCDPDCGDFDKVGDWFNLAMPYAGLSAWF